VLLWRQPSWYTGTVPLPFPGPPRCSCCASEWCCLRFPECGPKCASLCAAVCTLRWECVSRNAARCSGVCLRPEASGRRRGGPRLLAQLRRAERCGGQCCHPRKGAPRVCPLGTSVPCPPPLSPKREPRPHLVPLVRAFLPPAPPSVAPHSSVSSLCRWPVALCLPQGRRSCRLGLY